LFTNNIIIRRAVGTVLFLRPSVAVCNVKYCG